MCFIENNLFNINFESLNFIPNVNIYDMYYVLRNFLINYEKIFKFHLIDTKFLFYLPLQINKIHIHQLK
jgi:hypothetical protein